MTITITPTQLLPQQVRVQKQLDLKTLFTATDNSGTIDHYKITTNANFGGSIADTTASTSIVGASQTLIVSAADLLSYIANNAVGAESFTIQASDNNQVSYSNAVTISANVVADSAPTVMAVPNPPSTVTVSKTYGAAQLFQASDLNFDPIASYTITTPTAGGGVFNMINGAHTTDASNTTGALAAGTTYTISGADLANLTFTTAASAGSTSFQVAANDGLQTGASLTVALNVQLNSTPMVTTPTPSPILLGSLTAASSLIQASDADGTAISGYSIHVQAGNSGFFTLDGVTPVALDGSNNFFASPANFANLHYKASNTVTGTDQFTVTAIAQPSSGTVFSAVTPLSVNVVATAPPVVTQSAGASSVAAGTTVNASTLFTATDPVGNPIQGYSIIPSSSGQFAINGVALAANTPTFVSAANFPLLQYTAGATPGTAQFQAAASDGMTLGNFSTITVTSAAAATPTITTPATTPTIEPNNPVAVSSLFSGSEPGGSIQSYSIIMPSSLGHLTLNGTTLATDQPVLVSSSDFANLKFVATAAPGAASFQAAAYDGHTFSAYTNVPVNLAGPTVSQVSTLGANSLVTSRTYAASSLFSLGAVPGGAPVTGFSIQTPPAGAGTFFNGTTALASNQPVFLNASDLANLTLHTSASAGPVIFQVSAFDGTAFGQPKLFSLNSVVNSAPTVAAASSSEQVPVQHTVLASSLFNTSDLNGDAITAYQITPGAAPGGGVFSGAGLSFAPGTTTTVTAAQLATLKYTAGGPSPLITLTGNVNNPGAGVSAIPGNYSFTTNDGASYSGTLQLNFSNATTAQLQIATLTANAGSPAITAGLPITLGTVTFNGGGNATGFTAASTAVPVSAGGSLLLGNGSLAFSSLTATAAATSVTTSVASFQPGAQDSFTVAATDDPAGLDFTQSTAATIKVLAVANQPPVAVALPQTLPILTGTSVAGTSLFSATDPEGDPIQSYSIAAPPASVGTFSGFTSQDPVTGLIYVQASDLANLRFTAGAQAGSGSFQVSAFDGVGWSQAATGTVTTVAPQPPTVTLTPPVVVRPNATIAASSMFSATDPRGAPITAYSILTPNGNNGYFTLNGVPLADNTQNYVTAAQLSSLVFVGGPNNAPASFGVSAFNGAQWSDYATEQVNVSTYQPPVLTPVASATPPNVVAGGTFALSTLVASVTTDSGNPVQQYIVSASDGSFSLNGQTVSAKTPLTVSAADFANLKFIAPATLGTVTVNIAANDGTATGASVATPLSVSTNAGPTMTQSNAISTLLPGQTYAAGTLFNATDASGLPITGYFVTAQTGDGRFQLKSSTGAITPIPQGTKQFVSVADLANLQYVTGSSVSAAGALAPAGTVVSVLDANQGSGYTSATVTLPPPPSGGTQAAATAQIVNGKVVSITVTDPGSGYTSPVAATLSGNGTGASGPVLDLSQPFSTFTVSASDSVTEGAPITVLVNPLANLTGTTVIPVSPLPHVSPGGTVNANKLLSAIGAAGAPVTAYNLSADVGAFTLNGTPLTTGQLSFVTPDVFASLVYTAPSVPGTAHIQALAFDGKNWSPAVQLLLSIS